MPDSRLPLCHLADLTPSITGEMPSGGRMGTLLQRDKR
jgi:hypothetical protein